MPKEKARARRREGLKMTEEGLNDIIDRFPYPIMIYNDQGCISMVNGEWSRLTGYPQDDPAAIAEWELKVFGSPGLSLEAKGERLVATRDGSALAWEFASVNVGMLANGREATICTAVDITARRRAERARRENAEKFSALAEESPLGIVIAREDAIVYSNGTAADLFGIPARLAQGMGLGEWLGALPSDASPVLRALLRGESSHATPFRIDEGTWIEAFGKQVGAASGDMIMATFLDVTDRVRSEERERVQRKMLIQAEKLASIGELVAGVAHEINNPNHAIALNADILADVWGSVSPILARELEGREGDLLGGMEWEEAREEIPRLLSGIAAASRDIEAIVRGLKDFARGEDRPETEEVAINLVVKAALTLLSNYIKKATSHLVLDLEENIPPVRAHFQRLEQVAVNLIQNACQALTDPAQAIRVSTAYDGESGMVRLVVADGGRGMTPELIDRIKDPFFTTKHDLGGVGLGVSISDSIVAEYGGRLEYSSEPGKGTIASVSLRADRSEAS